MYIWKQPMGDLGDKNSYTGYIYFLVLLRCRGYENACMHGSQ